MAFLRPKSRLVHLEPLGGIALETMREIYHLADRCKSGGALDRTKYGRTRAGPKDFVNLHVQRLATPHSGGREESISDAILQPAVHPLQAGLQASACSSCVGRAQRRLARP